MNEIIKSLYERKSIRAFSIKNITDEEKNLIIDAAIQAPTAGNQVLYTILDIEEQSIKEALAVSCDNQPFIAKAPLVLLFLADCRRWLDCYEAAGVNPRKPGLGDLMLACEDALIAAQNSVVAAHSLGIGSCYIGDILENKEKVTDLLNLDKYVFPAILLVYGYPSEQQKNRKKPGRFDRKYIVRKNRYSRLSESELRDMFYKNGPDEEFDFESYISAFCRRKYMSDFSLEMTRSVSEYLENFKDD